MFPMSSLSAFSGLPSAMQAAAMQQTGVPGLNGGYAYPPGSGMASFMANLNNTVAEATRAPDGSDILSWANRLAQQSAIRQQQAQALAAQSASTATGSGNNMMQMLQSMLSMLISQLSGQSSARA